MESTNLSMISGTIGFYMKSNKTITVVLILMNLILIVLIYSFKGNNIVLHNRERSLLRSMIDEKGNNAVFFTDRRLFNHPKIMEGEFFEYKEEKSYYIIATFSPYNEDIKYSQFGHFFIWYLLEPDSREEVLTFVEEFLTNAYKHTNADSAKYSLYRYYRRTGQLDKAIDKLYFFKLSTLTVADHMYSFRELYEYHELKGVKEDEIQKVFESLLQRYPYKYPRYPEVYKGIVRYLEENND